MLSCQKFWLRTWISITQYFKYPITTFLRCIALWTSFITTIITTVVPELCNPNDAATDYVTSRHTHMDTPFLPCIKPLTVPHGVVSISPQTSPLCNPQGSFLGPLIRVRAWILLSYSGSRCLLPIYPSASIILGCCCLVFWGECTVHSSVRRLMLDPRATWKPQSEKGSRQRCLLSWSSCCNIWI